MTRKIITFALLLLPAAIALPLGWAPALAYALLVLILFLGWTSAPRGWRGQFTAALALAGGTVGVGGAVSALLTVGTEPVYSVRVGFGWAALALAMLGAAAINHFYINTPYLLAVPLWLAALAFLLMGGDSRGFVGRRAARSR